MISEHHSYCDVVSNKKWKQKKSLKFISSSYMKHTHWFNKTVYDKETYKTNISPKIRFYRNVKIIGRLYKNWKKK